MTITTAIETTREIRREAALLCLRAETQQQERKHLEAIRLAERAATIMPDAPEPHAIAGRSLLILGFPDQAIAEFATAYELTADDDGRFDALRNRAWAHGVAGQLDHVENCLGEMLRIRPDCRSTLMRRAVTRGHRKDFHGALDDIHEAVRRHGPDADTHNLLGHAHRALAFQHLDDLGETEEAQRHMEKALLHLEMAIEHEDARPQAYVALQQTNACRHLFGMDED